MPVSVETILTLSYVFIERLLYYIALNGLFVINAI